VQFGKRIPSEESNMKKIDSLLDWEAGIYVFLPDTKQVIFVEKEYTVSKNKETSKTDDRKFLIKDLKTGISKQVPKHKFTFERWDYSNFILPDEETALTVLFEECGGINIGEEYEKKDMYRENKGLSLILPYYPPNIKVIINHPTEKDFVYVEDMDSNQQCIISKSDINEKYNLTN
jgi:hypothetical protein